MKKFKSLKTRTHMLILFTITIILFYGIAFSCAGPAEIIDGFNRIVRARDVLITDYFIMGGYGAAFFNSALVMTISLAIILILKMDFTGLTVASIMIMGGFALFGKQPFNILPIIFGTIFYAKVQGVKASRYIHVGFLASGVAPIITELNYLLPCGPVWNMVISVLVGVLIGFAIVPLSAHTVGMHLGYNIFNVGFAAGIIALCVMTVLSMLGFKSETMLIWTNGVPDWLLTILICYFLFLIYIWTYTV